MLKIKDGIDLKELEKYGFIKVNIMDGDECVFTNIYCAINDEDKIYIENNCINDYFVQFFINEDNEVDYCCYPEQRSETFIENKFFELIKDELVEKVGE